MQTDIANQTPHMTVGILGGEAVDIGSGDHTISKRPCRGFWVGGAGNIKFDAADGDAITLNSVQAGTFIALADASKVYQSGTTATNIIATK